MAVEILGNVDWASMLSQALFWLGYGLLIVFLFGGMAAVYFLMQYKYKAEVYVRRSSGNDSDFSIGKIYHTRIKQFKKKGNVLKWKLLKGNKEIDPLEDKHILPGNRVKLFQVTADKFVPVKFTCGNPSAYLNPLPNYIMEMAALQIKQGAEDYQKQNVWDKYGNVIVMMGTVLFCLILVGVTVYFTYQHANGVQGSLGALTESIKSTNVLEGIKR